ncbi:hypothetical protein PFTANZ_04527 [Plasmodium falciparum Tanzania (2000708)]|uniref:t-SNARE coiled-coil homology domain-containing protein n=1 Tax=Plasmodium falciparum Tanzania (2000708) TaxID=1036725 RepID=A0A024W2D1_PLAFA|nr:hypothetical protein PFTANZ_04527 [Plasmodium falciparum Tanzania (2000708)]
MNVSFNNNGQQQVLKQPSKHSYLHSRADAMENIQKVIGDLAQMFQKVATMVTQQDEMIKRIDEDIDISLTNTREGQNYLLTYFNRLTSTRTLILQNDMPRLSNIHLKFNLT